jgi:hypothetical protein
VLGRIELESKKLELSRPIDLKLDSEKEKKRKQRLLKRHY